MPDLDFMAVRVDDISVGDLLDFDALFRRLPDREQVIVSRKIAHAVSEGDAAQERISLRAAVDDAEIERDEAKEEGERLADENTKLEARNKELDRELSDLRDHYADVEGRHDRQLQEAEVRGYQRGKADAREAA